MHDFLLDHATVVYIICGAILVISLIAVFAADPFGVAVLAGFAGALVAVGGGLIFAGWHSYAAQERWYQYAADRIVEKYDITINQWGPLDTDGGVWVINGEATTCGTGWADEAYTDILLVCGGVEQKVR